MTRCRSCRAPIEFVRTAANDRTMPLDLEPDPAGNVVVVDGKANVLGPLELELVEDRSLLRMPHHATCPNAGDWKGPR